MTRPGRLAPPLAVLALLVGAAASPSLAAAQRISGRVLDARADLPIPGVQVLVLGTADSVVARALTGGDGRFAVEVPAPGAYRIALGRMGYDSVVVEDVEVPAEGPDPVVEIRVEPRAIGLDPIRVTRQRFAGAQIISGLVLDGLTSEPLVAADVIVEDVRGEPVARSISNEDGHFWVRVDGPGLYSLRLSRIGYDSTRAVTVAAAPDQNLFIEIRANPVAVGLDPITVSAPRVLPYLEASGFYDRMRRGHGDFLGPRDIARFPGAFPSHLLRRIAGVSVSARGGIYMRGINSFSGGPCSPTIVLDGMTLREAELDDLIPLSHIDAIEVYKGAATVPPQWRGYGVCGVIAVWTKH